MLGLVNSNGVSKYIHATVWPCLSFPYFGGQYSIFLDGRDQKALLQLPYQSVSTLLQLLKAILIPPLLNIFN